MGIGGKRLVREAVREIQDNYLLRQMVSDMSAFIVKTGLLTFAEDTYKQKASVQNYFKAIAIEKLIEKGLYLDVKTIWGKDASAFVLPEDLNDEFDEDIENEELDNEEDF